MRRSSESSKMICALYLSCICSLPCSGCFTMPTSAIGLPPSSEIDVIRISTLHPSNKYAGRINDQSRIHQFTELINGLDRRWTMGPDKFALPYVAVVEGNGKRIAIFWLGTGYIAGRSGAADSASSTGWAKLTDDEWRRLTEILELARRPLEDGDLNAAASGIRP